MTEIDLLKKHLKEKHGYDFVALAVAHPQTLQSEHDRIHEKLDCDHTHEPPKIGER